MDKEYKVGTPMLYRYADNKCLKGVYVNSFTTWYGVEHNVIVYTRRYGSLVFPSICSLNANGFMLAKDDETFKEEERALGSIRFEHCVKESDFLIGAHRFGVCTSDKYAIMINNFPKKRGYGCMMQLAAHSSVGNGKYTVLHGKYRDELLMRLLSLTEEFSKYDIHNEQQLKRVKDNLLSGNEIHRFAMVRYLARKKLGLLSQDCTY